MPSHHLSPSSVISFILTVALTAPAYRAALDINEQYLNCSKSFQCGNINTGYPFWGQDRQQYCGLSGFKLDCISGVPQIFIKMENYRVLGVNNRSQTLNVARADLWNNTCPTSFFNTTLDLNLFNYTSDTRSLMLYYDCPLIGELSRSRFNCGANGTNLTSYYVTSDLMSSFGDRLRNCSNSIVVYVYQTSILGLENLSMDLVTALNTGFGLQWNVNNNFPCESCVESFGQCGTDPSSNEPTCYCPDQAYSYACPAIRVKTGPVIWLNMRNSYVNSVVSLFGSIFGSIVIYFICMRICCNRRKNDQNLEEFIRNQRSLGPRRYTYREVKRMTKSFKRKLGQGGYGTVYKGKLPDGRLVAVKVLSDSKGNGEEFMNEVASISKTSHVNVVNLLGFCYDRKRRALIYEFMPNGSLDKYIYDDKSPRRIEWKTLYEIAVGIARGLEYLHLGCNTRILHFDIKPNNILLDENFCPKISDFGLAKLCERRESSTISMLGARGTIGFIAPEVFCRIFGGVSHKSDVYSYGMMVLEMVGGRKNLDARASRTSEEYFPDWIHKQLEPAENLRVRGFLSDEEEETVRKMILVSLWCIQTNPADRPSMSKVVEMLSGSLQSLPIPPKPNLSSSPAISSADEEPSTASSSEVTLTVEGESTSREEIRLLNTLS